MFSSVGRRLALLNAAVVVTVIAGIGVATFLLLRQSLDREADEVLAERAEAGRAAWAELFATGQALPEIASRRVASGDNEGDDEEDELESQGEDEEEDEEAHELLESGDTLLFAVDANGRVLANSRGLIRNPCVDYGNGTIAECSPAPDVGRA